MNRLFKYMLKMPLELLVSSMDVFLKVMQDFQVVYNEAMDDLTMGTPQDVTKVWDVADRTAEEGATDNSGAASGNPGTPQVQPLNKEKRTMASVDLGGDDVKNVSYWITFVKPDFVTTLQKEQSETIDYATDEGSFGGLKIARFFQDLATKGIKWPTEWTMRPSSEYPPLGSQLFEIPKKDEKYIKFNLKLNFRQPLPDAEREKEKVEVLREIRDRL
jgi:hypothetical protein